MLLLHHGGRPLEMSVDAASLPEGLHYTGRVQCGCSVVDDGWGERHLRSIEVVGALK